MQYSQYYFLKKIVKGSSRIRRKSWHTASINHADNNSRPLPNQHYILLKKKN